MILNFEKWQRLHEAEMATAGNSVAVQAAQKFYAALEPIGNDDEAAARDAVLMLKNKADFDAFNAKLAELAGKPGKEFFNSEMSPGTDRDAALIMQIVNHIKKITNNVVDWEDKGRFAKFARWAGKGMGPDGVGN